VRAHSALHGLTEVLAALWCFQCLCQRVWQRRSIKLSVSSCACRIAPHVAITLIMLEAIKAYEAKIGL
jgi:hypothetical protein